MRPSEPFDTRNGRDYRIASICTVLANVNRGKHQRAYEVEQLVLKFGEQPQKAPKTWQEIMAIGQLFAAARER